MVDERLARLEAAVTEVSRKLDKYHEHTITHRTDIAWLKRAVTGVAAALVAGVGSLIFSKLGG